MGCSRKIWKPSVEISMNHENAVSITPVYDPFDLGFGEYEFTMQAEAIDAMDDREIQAFITFVMSVDTKTQEHSVLEWNFSCIWVTDLLGDSPKETEALNKKALSQMLPIAQEMLKSLRVTIPE